MKTTALILLIGIITHQSYRPALDGTLIVELGLLALFYFVGGRYIKEYFRSIRRKKHLKNAGRYYKSKSEPKTWRSATQTEVHVNKFIDTL